MDKDKEVSEVTPPKDKLNLTLVLFYCFGVLSLLPSQFFVTATNYWLYKFRDPDRASWSYKHRSELQTQFTSNSTIVSAVGNVVFMIGAVVFHQKISSVTRLWSSMIGMIAVLSITVAFVEIDTDSWQTGFSIMTLVTLLFFTGFCGVFLVTVFQMGAKFPPIYPGLVITGQAMAGLLSAVIQILSLTIGVPKTSGLVYFILGLALVILTLILYIYVSRESEFYNYCNNREISNEEKRISGKNMLKILDKLKYCILALIVISGSSIMVHPGVTSLVVSVNKGTEWNDSYFSPVATYFLYNLADLIGRTFALRIFNPLSPVVILVLSCIRVVLVPMLMLCNVQPRDHLSVVFNEDYLYIIFIVIFGASHGYLLNTCVVSLSRISTDEEKVTSMFLLLTMILVSAAGFSFASKVLVSAI